MSTKSELLPTPTPLRSDVDGGAGSGSGGTNDEPNVFDMRARTHLAGSKDLPQNDFVITSGDMTPRTFSEAMTPRTILSTVASAELPPPDAGRRGNGTRSSPRRQPLPLGSGSEAPESAGVRADVLMPAMPRTMSTGLDLLRMAQTVAAPSAGDQFVAPSLPGLQSQRQPSNAVAASLLSLSSAGSSPVVGPINEYELGLSRTGTPTQDAASVNAGSAVAGAPPSLPGASAPLMTPSYFLNDMTPGVPPPGDVLPSHYQKTDEAAVLLHQFRKGVRTPTPTSSLAKEENVFERNLSILSKAPAVDSALVAPVPRHMRMQQQQQQLLDPGARPADVMMPDTMLANLPQLAVAPTRAGGRGAAAAAATAAAGKGTKRKAPAPAHEPSPSPALDSMASGDDDDDDDDDDDSPVPRKRKGQVEDESILAKKKKRRREKCRIAATRFRQKKREEMRMMEETSTLLQQENADLTAEMAQLRRKIMETKVFLMQHEKCLAAAQQQQLQQQQQQQQAAQP